MNLFLIFSKAGGIGVMGGGGGGYTVEPISRLYIVAPSIERVPNMSKGAVSGWPV